MQRSRRISGLISASWCSQVAAVLVWIALATIIAIKWVGFTRVLLLVAILTAFALIAAGVEWMLRRLTLNEVKRDFQDINAAIGVLKDLGNNAMSPAVLKKFKWSVEEVLKGVVERRDLEEWLHHYRGALLFNAGLTAVSASAIAAMLAAFAQIDVAWHWSLFLPALLPIAQLIFGTRTLPKMDVASPEELADIIFEIFLRLNDPKMAVKNSLTSAVDVGVDSLSEIVGRRIVAWAMETPNLKQGTCQA